MIGQKHRSIHYVFHSYERQLKFNHLETFFDLQRNVMYVCTIN